MRKKAFLIGIDEYPLLGERYSLEGCRNDVELMKELLVENYGFPKPRTLLNEEATRQGILEIMGELLRTASSKDHIVLYFSGHGSQVIHRKTEPFQGIDYIETIVPYDSGRLGLARSAPNRDISDKEFRSWLHSLCKQKARVTLLFDCCHSGGILRDTHSAKVRQAPAGEPPSAPEPPAWSDSQIPTADPSLYTLWAACRPRELAFELPEEGHGALTFYLAQSLFRSRGDNTPRELLQWLAPRVTARFPSQHPICEGQLEYHPFGDQKSRPVISFTALPLKDRNSTTPVPPKDVVEISAGAVHGVQPNSHYSIHPLGTTVPKESKALGIVRLEEVFAVSSRGHFLEEGAGSLLPLEGGRAFLEAQHSNTQRLAVFLGAPFSASPLGSELVQRIELSPWLQITSGPKCALYLHLLEPRSIASPDSPLPQLGPLSRPLLAASGMTGELVAPIVPVEEANRLVAHLEALARCRNLLAIENPRGSDELETQIDLELWKQGAESWRPIDTSSTEAVTCRVGERLGIRITNRSPHKIFPYVLDLGLTGKVTLLHPFPGAYEPLEPQGCLELGLNPHGRSLELRLPEELPFDALLERPVSAIERYNEYIKVFLTHRETDFSMFHNNTQRSLEPHLLGNTLQQFLWTAWSGTERLIRCRPSGSTPHNENWITLTRCFEVEL